ncbi:hypothetical protein C2G38_2040366 [Gigaspora rosea]|uniref:Uncharacterized protein n=1 Tax=Gigaspora rosea TaxID=44941 RepID=A0A397UWT8_9GLOM|nr:hypothetical protein C2G38_2040366 [Gigaspora rosea]
MDSAFKNRELGFTLPSDAYLRYNSYNGEEDLKAEIMKMCPTKIDIGAIYTAKWCIYMSQMLEVHDSGNQDNRLFLKKIGGGGTQVSKKVQLNRTLHPFLRRSLGIIENYFEDIVLKDQDVLGSEENWSKVLNYIQDDVVINLTRFRNQKKLSNKWNGSNSVQKWDELVNELEHAASASGRKVEKQVIVDKGCRLTKFIKFLIVGPSRTVRRM